MKTILYSLLLTISLLITGCSTKPCPCKCDCTEKCECTKDCCDDPSCCKGVHKKKCCGN